ncbi:MAG: alpha/beta fold hydrolase [Maribacter sp.]|nr:alpha/beta fold hydrolase [Maribacter sp.]
MPLREDTYDPPLYFKSGHFSTIYAGLWRKVNGVNQKRVRFELPDGDFIDLDWSFASHPSDQVVILLHGLEGHGQRPYITGSAKIFNASGIDACAVNFRGCSGETNRLFRSYHSGATEDLHSVVQHVIHKKYNHIFINGVSLGGNLALEYAGEPREIPKEVKAVIGISVPCDLHSSLKELLKPKNYLYAKRFRKHLVDKLKLKQLRFPEMISDIDIKNIKTLKDFDDIYTSRAHGFIDALDYYKKSSSLQFLNQISIPSLIINAQNDSFLGKECYPYQEAKKNRFISLEVPKYGGHVGFAGPKNITYSEKRAINFIKGI